MFQEKALLTFYAETSVHMGAGQSVSYVDLPVQRERITGFPIFWASGIKGVLREVAERVWNNSKIVKIIFGPKETKSQKDIFASCISITDAKILLYPVRSVRGIFAWITCPFVLKRFKEDLKSVGEEFKVKNGEDEISIPDFSEEDKDKVYVASNSVLKINSYTIALEEFVFKTISSKDRNLTEELANFLQKFLPDIEFKDSLSQRLVIVSDDVFRDFVNYAVEVRTRIKIDQTKGTVEEGALFTEELIPSESVFYSLVFIAKPYSKNNTELSEAQNVADELKKLFSKIDLIQLGADETVGRGFMRVKFYTCENRNTTEEA